MIQIPEKFRNVRYEGARIPGCEKQKDLSLGSNCQLFAYEFLRHHGFIVPDYRSSELWADEKSMRFVNQPVEFDIMFYHDSEISYGAHLGVSVGNGLVLHLSRANVTPKIEKHSDLLAKPEYRIFIGAKRARNRIQLSS